MGNTCAAKEDDIAGNEDIHERCEAATEIKPERHASPWTRFESDKDATALMMSFITLRNMACLSGVSKRMQTITFKVISLIEHMDVDTDLIQRHSVPEIVEARERQKEYESKFERSDYLDDEGWRIRQETHELARKYPSYVRKSGHYTCYRIDDAWLMRHGAHLKHVALWRHVNESHERSVDQTYKIKVLSSLVKHSHQHLVSLVNLQITPRDSKVILKALGRSRTLRSLSHVTVEVAGYIGRRGDKYFSRNFHNGVNTTSRLLAKCPALTSVGISEANKWSFGLTLAKLFERSMGTLKNLRCLSIQLAFANFCSL